MINDDKTFIYYRRQYCSSVMTGLSKYRNSSSMTLICFFISSVLTITTIHSFQLERINRIPTNQIAFYRRCIESPLSLPYTHQMSQLQMLNGIGGGVGSSIIIVVNNTDDDERDDRPADEEEDEDDDEAEEEDSYRVTATSEFEDSDNVASASSISLASAIRSSLLSSSSSSSSSTDKTPTTTIDWGGALGTLRKRMDDVESGISQKPSQALFRLMSAQSPNQLIGTFVKQANPSVVQAMSGAVDSLLGGLSNPAAGIETIIKATGDKIGSLCFQLQMTGYMFRNAEYVMALKKIMQLEGTATLQDYKEAFERIDVDKSGYIEISEVETLLRSVYGNDSTVPEFEIGSFMKFFDTNLDGKISWDEFERGLGAVLEHRATQTQQKVNLLGKMLPAGGKNTKSDNRDDSNDDDEDEEDESEFTMIEPEISGTIEIEMEGGEIVEVDAKEYLKSLQDEARMLKEILEKQRQQQQQPGEGLQKSRPLSNRNSIPDVEFGSITSYIASRQGDVKSLTEGISPEIVDTMKMLVDYVLEGGERGTTKNVRKEELELQIPGSALQQLALWQLILGYRLREFEAKGDYLRLLE